MRRPKTIDDAAGRVELDDHVRALVDGPDVVVAIDAHRVRERPGVEALADLAHELAVRAELEQLRGRRRVGRPAGAVRRVKTKTCPFELTATPDTSPKFMPSGSLRKSATESNSSSGTCCGIDAADRSWAPARVAGPPVMSAAASTAAKRDFMSASGRDAMTPAQRCQCAVLLGPVAEIDDQDGDERGEDGERRCKQDDQDSGVHALQDTRFARDCGGWWLFASAILSIPRHRQKLALRPWQPLPPTNIGIA